MSETDQVERRKAPKRKSIRDDEKYKAMLFDVAFNVYSERRQSLLADYIDAFYWGKNHEKL